MIRFVHNFKEYRRESMYPVNPYMFVGKIIKSGLAFLWDASSKSSYPGTGTTVFDISGNNNYGVLTNGVAYNTAEMGGQFIFDGVNDCILGPIIEPQQYTIGLWFKATGAPSANNDATGSCLISTNPQNIPTTTGMYWISYSYSAKRLTIKYRTATYLIESVSDNTWHHISFSSKNNDQNTNTDATICYDGTIISTSVAGVGYDYPTSGVRNMSLGRWGYTGFNRYFKGNIPLAYMYTRAISEAEMLRNYKETKSFFGL